MEGHFIFSTKILYFILENKNFNKNNLFITDKILIFNILRKKKLKSICLDQFINGNQKKKLLLKYYFEFDKSLKKLGEKHKTNIGKFRINTIYNTFGFFSPRLYVGLKFLELTIIKISRKYKIKNIFYYKDLKNFYLDSYFYEKALRKICKESKIRLEVKSEKKNQILNIDKFINLLRKINYFLKEANFLKIKLIVKKFLLNLYFS